MTPLSYFPMLSVCYAAAPHAILLSACDHLTLCISKNSITFHGDATPYLLKFICIALTLNYECLLRESDCLLLRRELLSAILFSTIAVVHKPLPSGFFDKTSSEKQITLISRTTSTPALTLSHHPSLF